MYKLYLLDETLRRHTYRNLLAYVMDGIVEKTRDSYDNIKPR